jgi:hypothetical protein
MTPRAARVFVSSDRRHPGRPWKFILASCPLFFFAGRVRVSAMLLVTSNKSKQLLHIRFIGHVRPVEFAGAQEDLSAELGQLSPGFHYLVDFSQFEFMEPDCTLEVGRIMELIAQAGVGLVVRVIPDSSKDIGMNILSIFHYPRNLQVVTCQTLTQAGSTLGLP